MSPDSPEARLARLDEALRNANNRLDTMVEAYAPTNRQVIENGLRIAEFREDLAELRADLKRTAEHWDEFSRKLENKVLSCTDSTTTLEKRLRAEQAEREKERQARNRWLFGLAAAFITAIASVYLGTVLG